MTVSLREFRHHFLLEELDGFLLVRAGLLEVDVIEPDVEVLLHFVDIRLRIGTGDDAVGDVVRPRGLATPCLFGGRVEVDSYCFLRGILFSSVRPR